MSEKRPWKKQQIKSKPITLSLPKNYKIDSVSLVEILKKHRIRCPLCEMPWPEKFELDSEIEIVCMSLPEKLVSRLQCLDNASNFIKTILEAEKNVCPACKR